MLIDKKARLFGKVSIIDIITLLLFVAIFLLFFKQLGVLNTNKNMVSKLDDLEIIFYQPEVNDFTAENVNIGDPTKESLKNASFGKVVDIKTDESVSWYKDPDGLQIPASREGYCSIYITMEAKGRLTNNGFILDGSSYHVGQTITFKAGNSIFYGNIAGVKKI